MTPPTRKERELAERERLILDVAARLLVERGYLGLTMDRIAAATEYSKGTIYQHFQNKEDILTALAAESAQRRVSLFERAATLRGKPRERLCAVGLAANLFVQLHPLHFHCEGIIGAQSIRSKASEKRIQELESCEVGCMEVIRGLARDAVSQGDLAYEDPAIPQVIVLGLWSMTIGFHHILSVEGNAIETKLGFEDPQAALFSAYDRYLDGFGWRPLSSEWDYRATFQRAREEVFAAEHLQLSSS